MMYLNLYEILSPAIIDSQMPSLFPDFAALALQPELAASFLWAQSTLSLPPLVQFPHSTGLLVYASVLPALTAFRWCHVSSISILMFPCTGPGKTQALCGCNGSEWHCSPTAKPAGVYGWVPLQHREAVLGGERALWMVRAESAAPLAQTLAPFFGIAPESRSGHGTVPIYLVVLLVRGFPGSSDGKESACNARDLGSIPGSGGSSEEGSGNPLQYSCLENSMEKGAWWAAVHRVTKSQAQQRD